MLFPTKSKVNAALVDLLARSARIELKTKELKKQLADGDAFFGPVTEVDDFALEMSETSQGLAMFMVALERGQMKSRQISSRLSEFSDYIERQERTITTAQRSYAISRGQL